jgi:hypothetical protein
MRQGSNPNKRMRGRGGNGGNGGPGRKGPNPLTRSYESTGPDVKIRGTAHHIAEKYVTLARDAQSSGDRVLAENYLQHAEHYYRLIAAAQAQLQQPIQIVRSDIQTDDEDDDDLDTAVDVRANYVPTEAPQPYVEDAAMERIQAERRDVQPREPRDMPQRERGDRPERMQGERQQGERMQGEGRYGDRRFGRDRNDRYERGEGRPRGEFQQDRAPRYGDEGEAQPGERPERQDQRSDMQREPRGDRQFRGRDRGDRRFEPRFGREDRPQRGDRYAGERGPERSFERTEEAEAAPQPAPSRARVNVEEALPTGELPAFITAVRRAPTRAEEPQAEEAKAPVAKAQVEEAPEPKAPRKIAEKIEEQAVSLASPEPEADAGDEAPAPKKRARGTRGRGRKATEADAAEAVVETAGEE